MEKSPKMNEWLEELMLVLDERNVPENDRKTYIARLEDGQQPKTDRDIDRDLGAIIAEIQKKYPES